MINFSTQSPDNYEQKCCCVLVLDVSASMAGAPIQQLNRALQEFHTEIQEDSTAANRLEIAIVEFASDVKTLVDPSLVENFSMPVLATRGTTALVDGVREGINIARTRKAWYRQTGQPYYRPWVVLITDGAPDPGQDIAGLANEIKDSVANKDFWFFVLAVDGSNMNILTSISDPSMPPSMLSGTKFMEFFQWLSASMSTITSSKEGDKINLPSPGIWMKGFTV